jgi:tRNA1Val (adenine37-N6)-methyltransferase
MIDPARFPNPEIRLTEERSLEPDFLKEALFQPQKGYRFSADSLLLAEFIQPRPNERILEFGGGCGIIPLILAKKNSSVKIISIEIQDELVSCARKNVELYHLKEQIEFLQEDANTAWEKLLKGSFQRIITNPPYREAGMGRLNPEIEKAIARHEISLSLKNIIQWSRELLAPEGKINFIFPSIRNDEVIALLKKNQFELVEVEEIKRVRNGVRLFEASYNPKPSPIVIPTNASSEGHFK